MFEAHANENFEGSVDDVFALLSDHEAFLHGFDIDRCVVTTPGAEERNGLGAIREVFSGPMHFVEEVVRFERPHRYDYVIRRLTLHGRQIPVDHDLGWVELQEAAGLVRVDWFSRFRLNLPLVSKFLEPRMGKQIAGTFGNLLTQARKASTAA